MNMEPLKKVLSTLIEMRASMYDAANTSATQQLDEAISLIQVHIENGSASTGVHYDVLSILGKVFEKLPSIVALLQLLSK